MNFSEKLILALDFPTEKEALSWVDLCIPYVKTFKVGKQLFTKVGPSIVRAIHERGGRVFLDTKFHDIPNTVAEAVASAAELGVFMCNMHASGGIEMMKAARNAVSKLEKKPLLMGVTILTSLSSEDLKQLGYKDDVASMVLRLAKLSKEAGMDGVVCSVGDVEMIKAALGKDFITVTPGIRFSDSSFKGDDQKRVATPERAHQVGSDYWVVGRSLFRSEDPLTLLRKTIDKF